MIYVKRFENNPFAENTYILYDETHNCAIVDPGMYTTAEEESVLHFIRSNNLKPTLLLNTHCHVDHVLGNKLIYEEFGLLPQFHEHEAAVLSDVQVRAPMFGLRYEQSPIPEHFLPMEGNVSFGNTSLQLIFAPGHSPGHLCFYNQQEKLLIGGDVLFRRSIGRTDLPGGNHQLLLKHIKEDLYSLPDDTIVYPGHGPETYIGEEKVSNPFVRA
ncbi:MULTISPECIES: MBL fold metallo-hydrolase [Olivibacter]|jgi:glyoxylase-like metal-dependent hydrolase (beta-lactamase superfamily II)|uniref:MBL fold metallo-hydrolase n=1 Tax=Olivibacter jilunii TaxID=985016 RepID=A0ABW6B8V4_9SPHI|nr:MBL fold metallo-hydrolase [Olivibacter sp. UJ_SKK_5.1]MDX3912201.1 MBL fold metallo-hydrolase [Pseudosphingobacterium sp.]